MYIGNTNFTGKTLPALIDAALELVWPTRCAGCECPGSLLCISCKDALLAINPDERCPQCGAPYGRLICTECYDRSGKTIHNFSLASSAVEMDDLSGRMVVLYKDNNEHRLSSLMAGSLAASIPLSWMQWAEVITWVPADKKALKQRGFDHMRRIAAELATMVELPAQALLVKRTRRDQRGLSREERKSNLLESFSLCRPQNKIPRHVLLIDDVFTTGATLDAASAKLKEGGAEEIRVLSFTRVW